MIKNNKFSNVITSDTIFKYYYAPTKGKPEVLHVVVLKSFFFTQM